MKILHVLDHSIPLHSGYTFRSRNILEQQRKLGWDTYHLTSPKHNKAAGVDGGRETVDGLEFYRSRTPGGPLVELPFFGQWAVVSATLKRLREIIPDIQPDILHAHSPSLNGMAAVRAGREFSIPVVYEIRAFWEDAAVDHGTSSEGGLRYRLTRALETHVVNKADAVTTICEGLRGDLINRGVAEEKITVIPNAVDIEHFSMEGERDAALAVQLDLQNKTVLGFIGSFYAYEGLPLLVKSLPAILARAPDTRLLLVGGGPQEQEIKRTVGQLGLEDRVIFTGRVPHSEVSRYYSLVDIFVYPRLNMRLTDLVTPLKPLEAMAQGKLVLASDVGGHRELIRDGQNGVLFKAGDSDALATAALDLMQQQERWPKLKANGRHYVEEERNWPNSVARYQQVYTRLTQAWERRPRRE